MAKPHGDLMRHYDINDPEDLKALTIAGVIWDTRYAQKGVDLVDSGAVTIDELQNLPDRIRKILESE